MSAAPLEFRVLTGLHREACCLAKDGAVVGADAACDIVLADQGLAGRAGALRIYDHGWILTDDNEQPEHDALLPFNQPLALGTIWVTVARSQDTWLKLPEAANDAVSGPTAPDPDNTEETGQDAPPVGAGQPEASDPPEPEPAPPAAAASRSPGWPARIVLGLVIIAVIIAILIALLPSRRLPLPSADPQQTAQASISQITSIIERLGLTSRVFVSLSPAGTVSVEGWVNNYDEQDNLAAALSQIWPPPAMRVSNVSEAVRTAQFTLDAFNILYTPRYEGNGRLEVDGIASSARERASAMDALRARLPGIQMLQGHIMLASDVTQALSDRLNQAGLAGVALSWQANRLEADAGTLDAQRLAELQEVLEAFNAQNFGVVTIAHAASQAVSDSVPFQIRSIVSGPQPFIVLNDGAKIVEGGNYMGFVLEKVEPDRVIFGGVRSAIIVR